MNDSAHAVEAATATTAPAGRAMGDALDMLGRRLGYFATGLVIMLGLWWLAITLAGLSPKGAHWAAFGPDPAFRALAKMWQSGAIHSALLASGFRLGLGLGIAIAVGVPIGILMGRSKRFREVSNSPFQLLRMISPK